MSDFISVHITVALPTEAEMIARALVNEKLAACVNIIPEMRSVYRWNGHVEAAHEVVLIAKTRAALFSALEARVKELHPDEVPCILALPIIAGHRPYLDWLTQETT